MKATRPRGHVDMLTNFSSHIFQNGYSLVKMASWFISLHYNVCYHSTHFMRIISHIKVSWHTCLRIRDTTIIAIFSKWNSLTRKIYSNEHLFLQTRRGFLLVLNMWDSYTAQLTHYCSEWCLHRPNTSCIQSIVIYDSDDDVLCINKIEDVCLMRLDVRCYETVNLYINFNQT